ncbi:histone deacetylase [Micromonospora sp. WMMD998]|uniref:histone deacetylase n=1 Tax=Micromonospora sp. WMMD998 TaxID=3016092 RepID=UPI00249A8300|nr:histone deacetylase [Micromonospora sp. WMMD998]WFE38389.1 histone deacetylase [Micromonospora sp. WMMD998]
MSRGSSTEPDGRSELREQVASVVSELTPGPTVRPTHIWYVCYGSNMSLGRLNYYLLGGRPPAGALTYPGCRDKTPPSESRALRLPGTIYFALEALAWTGGMAFYDHGCPGDTPARGYHLTVSQFSDILAQEMNLEPGDDVDLTDVLDQGRLTLGPGCYQTLLHLGDIDGVPAFTFTSPWCSDEVEHRKPAAIYLRHLAAGLVEAHGWGVAEVATYLGSRPGAAGYWSPDELLTLFADLCSEATGPPRINPVRHLGAMPAPLGVVTG